MKNLTIRFDDDVLEDLRGLADRKGTTMAALVRSALDVTFEDELDLVAAERALEEAARHPDQIVTLQEFKKQRDLSVSNKEPTTTTSHGKPIGERGDSGRGI
ncbi:MAG: DUF6290 family protein [Dehalococcoidia bacterium]